MKVSIPFRGIGKRKATIVRARQAAGLGLEGRVGVLLPLSPR